MPDITLGSLLLAGLTGGVAAGFVNQGVGALRDMWTDRRLEVRQQQDRAHQRAMQEDERQHQAKLRAEAAHADAGVRHATHAADVRDWIDFAWAEAHGNEADYANIVTMRPAGVDVRGVVSRLAEIRNLHPTEDVRKRARALFDEVTRHFNFIPTYVESSQPANAPEPPTFDKFEEWQTMAGGLQSAILNPPPPE